MFSNEIAVRVENLSKCYTLYDAPRDRLRQFVLPRLQRVVGMPPRNYYREFWALKDVSFEVKKGETVGIIGRNGSGKSTLLQLICSTLTPTSGLVETHGRVAALLELGSGFNPEFTGRENVYMNGAVLGLSSEQIDARFDDIASFADIGAFLDQPIKSYSSGMQMRVAFAVAACIDPDILIVDETLSVGDEAFQRKCFARINEIKNRGATILFVSHAASTIVQLCDRAILMDRGERLLNGAPKVLVSLYQKLLYAEPDSVDRIRSEIRSIEGIPSHDVLKPADVDEVGMSSTNAKPSIATLDEEAEFDPGLVPKSTVEYSSKGARISDVHIQDMQGRKVNVLVHGQRYRYCYGVHFYEAKVMVGFGMALKTLTGIEISGQGSHRTADGLGIVNAGETVSVEFQFLNLLMPGTYFGNAGVASHQDGQVSYLHRITDAIMFSVKYFDSNQPVSCLVNLRPDGARVKYLLISEAKWRSHA